MPIYGPRAALGAGLHEMMTGKRALSGKSQVTVMSAILEKEPAPRCKGAMRTHAQTCLWDTRCSRASTPVAKGIGNPDVRPIEGYRVGLATDREGAEARSVAGPQLGDGVAEVQL
jgi:hypothetical protein